MAKDELLIENEKYLSSGIHIGSKYKTKYMRTYIYKIRPDGLAVLNLQKIDNRIKNAAKFLSQFKPDELIIATRRENCFHALKKFGEATGIKVTIGRYLPGTMTNPGYSSKFFEPKALMICDPWIDRNAINDALKIGIPILSICDTNNTTNNVDLVIPCNNKSKKSVAMVFYLLTREYLKSQKKIKSDKDFKYMVEDFEGEKTNTDKVRKPRAVSSKTP